MEPGTLKEKPWKMRNMAFVSINKTDIGLSF